MVQQVRVKKIKEEEEVKRKKKEKGKVKKKRRKDGREAIYPQAPTRAYTNTYIG